MSGDIGLGRILEEGNDAKKDAVHVACAPVIAGQVLKPGEHVGFY